MFSAFLLSANSRQSRASFFESIAGENGPEALKDKADCCGWTRPRRPAQVSQWTNPFSPASGSATTKRPTESPSAFDRETAQETKPSLHLVAESPRTA